MKNNFFKELPLLIIIAIPFVYLASIWTSLPERVPVHWDLHGNVNRWGSKIELILIPFLLPLLMYALLTFLPKIDPKKKIEAMGNKLYHLKFILTIFMSALATYIIYTAKSESLGSFNYITIFLGSLFAVMGNYFQSIKPNYFIGIRTPWTLENEDVWRKTHQLGGKMWLVGGLAIILSGLFLKESISFIIMIAITLCIVIVPVVYSYWEFKALSRVAD